MTRREERHQFFDAIRSELSAMSWRKCSDLVYTMQMKAKQYATIQERWCSEEMTDETTARLEKREANIEKWFITTLQPFGITPDFSGDPRGAVVKLKLPSGRTDDWGQTGLCVPEGN